MSKKIAENITLKTNRSTSQKIPNSKLSRHVSQSLVFLKLKIQSKLAIKPTNFNLKKKKKHELKNGQNK